MKEEGGPIDLEALAEGLGDFTTGNGACCSIGSGALAWKWHTALFFELGVVMIVGGGLTTAALWLWETPERARGEE